MRKKNYSAIITAVGMYVPEKVLDNAYFESIVDTTDEWIRTRTGIKERRMLENGATSDLAVKAAEDLFQKHNVNPREIDVIIVATVTPDMFFVSFRKELVQQMHGDSICLQLVQDSCLHFKLLVRL